MKKFKGILYINQFFAQIGGEEQADMAPEIREGILGPGLLYQSLLGDDVEITHTIICGDNYMGSHRDEAIAGILAMLDGISFDVFFAGPAFRAGRYGVACGAIAKEIHEKFNVPVFSGMNEENPGVEMFRKDVLIFKSGASAASMKQDVAAITDYALRTLKGEETLWADAEGYFGQGLRHQVFIENEPMAADRVVDMLLQRLQGRSFQTELPIKIDERVVPAAPLADLAKATIALVTSGGIVPVDNPHRIQSASATRWGKYDISALDRLAAGEYKTIHAGYDPTEADKNPNVVAPVDALKQYEQEGVIGKLHPFFYSTVGTGTTQSEATRMAEEIYADLSAAHVDGVILVST